MGGTGVNRFNGFQNKRLPFLPFLLFNCREFEIEVSVLA